MVGRLEPRCLQEVTWRDLAGKAEVTAVAAHGELGLTTHDGQQLRGNHFDHAAEFPQDIDGVDMALSAFQIDDGLATPQMDAGSSLRPRPHELFGRNDGWLNEGAWLHRLDACVAAESA